MLKSVIAVLIVLFSFSAHADEQHKLGNGFTYYHKSFQSGTQEVLIVEKILPARAVNPIVSKPRFGVERDCVPDNLSALKQFVELATAAESRGETISKDLGLVRAFNFGVYDYWNQFEIVTTTDALGHLGYALKITPSTKVLFKVVPTAVDPANVNDYVFPFNYNLDEVKSLITLLSSYQEGKINSTDASSSRPNESLLDITAGFQKGKTTLSQAKNLLGEPIQSMGMPEDSIRIDYAEQHSGRGQSATVVLIFDKQELLKDKVVFRW